MLSNKKLIGLKTETAQNTEATLAATDFLLAYDVEVTPDPELIPRPYNSPSLDPFSDLIGKKSIEVKFKTELKGSGSLGVAYAPLSAALQACGLVETISAGVHVLYDPSSAPATNFLGPGKSATCLVYEDGTLFKALGCIGDPSLVIEAGKPAMIEFTLRGVYSPVTDAAFATNTPNSLDPPIVQSSSLSIHSYAAIAAKLEIGFNNEVVPVDDVNSPTGLKGYRITGRNPAGSLDPEAVTVTTHDFFGKMMAGTLAAASIVIGSAAGNKITISLPKVQYQRITKGDRGGQLIYTIPLKFCRNTGDDWISIKFE